MPQLFTREGFADGHWAGGLKEKLDPNFLRELLGTTGPVVIAPGWHCRVRLWRATFQQWIQFEPNDLPAGPFFWSGKPAILSSPSALYAGYYVERGYPPEDATQEQKDLGEVMADDDKQWDWHRFCRLLSPGSSLSELLFKLPAERRCIWIWDAKEQRGHAHKFGDQPPFAAVKDHIKEIKRKHWIDLVVGVEYSLDDCLLPKDQIVKDLVQVDRDGVVLGPLKQAYDLYQLVRAVGDGPHQR